MPAIEPLALLPKAPQSNDEIVQWLNSCVHGKTTFCVYVTKKLGSQQIPFATKVIHSRTAIAVITRDLKMAGFHNVQAYTEETGGFRIILDRENVLSVIQQSEARATDRLIKGHDTRPPNALSKYFDAGHGVVEIEEGKFARASRPMPLETLQSLLVQLQNAGTEIAGVKAIPQSEHYTLYIAAPSPSTGAQPTKAPAPTPPSSTQGIEVRNNGGFILIL